MQQLPVPPARTQQRKAQNPHRYVPARLPLAAQHMQQAPSPVPQEQQQPQQPPRDQHAAVLPSPPTQQQQAAQQRPSNIADGSSNSKSEQQQQPVPPGDGPAAAAGMRTRGQQRQCTESELSGEPQQQGQEPSRRRAAAPSTGPVACSLEAADGSGDEEQSTAEPEPVAQLVKDGYRCGLCWC